MRRQEERQNRRDRRYGISQTHHLASHEYGKEARIYIRHERDRQREEKAREIYYFSVVFIHLILPV